MDEPHTSKSSGFNVLVMLVQVWASQQVVSSGPDWSAIVSAVSSVASAVVVVAGGLAAVRYLIRGVTSVEATASIVDGMVVIHVRPEIASQGATALRLSHEAEHAPTVHVVEYGREGPVGDGVSRAVLEGDDIVGPGETVIGSAIFVVENPGRGVLGWQVTFTVRVPRWFRREWFWVASTFVPAPPAGPRRA